MEVMLTEHANDTWTYRIGKSVEFESSADIDPGERVVPEEGAMAAKEAFMKGEGNERDGDSRKRREGDRGVMEKARKGVEVFHSAIRIQDSERTTVGHDK